MFVPFFLAAVVGLLLLIFAEEISAAMGAHDPARAGIMILFIAGFGFTGQVWGQARRQQLQIDELRRQIEELTQRSDAGP